MQCPKCRGEHIKDTGICIYTYPSYNVYECLDCGHGFEVCNNEEIPGATDKFTIKEDGDAFYANYIPIIKPLDNNNSTNM